MEMKRARRLKARAILVLRRAALKKRLRQKQPEMELTAEQRQQNEKSGVENQAAAQSAQSSVRFKFLLFLSANFSKSRFNPTF